MFFCRKDAKFSSAASDEINLPAGAHEFPFNYQLRENLPSSFESHDLRLKGRVHYLVRAKLDSPDVNLQLRRDRIIIVLQTLDLNKEPKVKVGPCKILKRLCMIPHACG